MKYRDLFEALKIMIEEQLDAEVMVFENDIENDECHLIADDINLNTASNGAIMSGGKVTDDYYGIADDADYRLCVSKLLSCNQPYLMVGNGCIPTCERTC